MTDTSVTTAAAGAAYFDGHFPGQPVVPGVVILDWVHAAIERRHGRSLRLEGIPGVKFISPLLPGEPLQIDLAPGTDGGLVSFSCHVGERRIATGSMRLALKPERE